MITTSYRLYKNTTKWKFIGQAVYTAASNWNGTMKIMYGHINANIHHKIIKIYVLPHPKHIQHPAPPVKYVKSAKISNIPNTSHYIDKKNIRKSYNSMQFRALWTSSKPQNTPGFKQYRQ